MSPSHQTRAQTTRAATAGPSRPILSQPAGVTASRQPPRRSPTAAEAAAAYHAATDDEMARYSKRGLLPPPELRMPNPGRSARLEDEKKQSRSTIRLLHARIAGLTAENEKLRRAWTQRRNTDQYELRHLLEMGALQTQNKKDRLHWEQSKERLHQKYAAERERAVKVEVEHAVLTVKNEMMNEQLELLDSTQIAKDRLELVIDNQREEIEAQRTVRGKLLAVIDNQQEEIDAQRVTIDERTEGIKKLTEGLEKVNEELKEMKKTCTCKGKGKAKAKVVETPVAKRTRSHKPSP